MRLRARHLPLLIALSVLLVFMLGPFLWLALSSLKSEAEIANSGPFDLPRQWLVENYVTAWQRGGFGRLMLNSVLNAVAVVAVTVLLAAPAAYAFARMRFAGRELLFWLVLAGLTIPAQAIVIPVWQTLAALGLINTLLGITLAQAGHGLPFAIFLLRNFFRALPAELVEAARIDGAGHAAILWHVILPLATPALLALTVIAALNTWNDYFLPLVVLISPEVQTIPLGLVRFRSTFQADDRLIFAGTVISFVPIVLVFIATQRHFVRGLTQGALKG